MRMFRDVVIRLLLGNEMARSCDGAWAWSRLWFILPSHLSCDGTCDLNRSVVHLSIDSLFHERHQNRKVHRLQEGTPNSRLGCRPRCGDGIEGSNECNHD